jgi:hypothetical protein
MQESEEIKKATSILYDSVRNVFFPVIKTPVKKLDELKFLMPHFNEETMSFSLVAVNKFKLEKQQYERELNNIIAQLNRFKVEVIPEEYKKQAEEIKKQLLKMQVETLKKLNNICDEKLIEYDNQIVELNKLLESAPKLYIHLEKNMKQSMENIGKRLQSVGLKFQDVDEDNYIDDLKNLKL